MLSRLLPAFLFVLPLLLPSAAGCAVVDSPNGSDSVALTEGTPAAIGVLRLVNAEAVDAAFLDIDVALDRRAAVNLIAARNGVDGNFGTGDDRLFQAISELDAVKFVGPSALAKLTAFADANGFVPGPTDVLGSFEGVVFTVAEAEAALALCNNESSAVLDVEVGLDRRAVDSIVSARPISSMPELASLYYVGGSALRALKNEVGMPTGRADCRGNGECRATEVCEGIPFDGSSDFGKCRPKGNVVGVGNGCAALDPCGPGLFCGGLTFGAFGMCIADWQQDTFANTTERFIAKESPLAVVTAVTVRGQATVPFDITVDIDLTHDDPSSLTIVLYDPNGTDAVLWNGPNEGGAAFPGSFVALGNISRDDTVNGRWLLRIFNEGGSGVGTLHSWTLWLSSNFD